MPLPRRAGARRPTPAGGAARSPPPPPQRTPPPSPRARRRRRPHHAPTRRRRPAAQPGLRVEAPPPNRKQVGKNSHIPPPQFSHPIVASRVTGISLARMRPPLPADNRGGGSGTRPPPPTAPFPAGPGR